MFISCWRGTEHGAVRISDLDYWNIAGRAGRAGEETEGTTIHLVIDPTDGKDYEHYLSKRDALDPMKTALFQMVSKSVSDRLSMDQFYDVLDPEILALLVEEARPELTRETIEDIIDSSLTKCVADRYHFPIERVTDAFVEVSQRIRSRVPDGNLWGTFDSTGLSSASCEQIMNFVNGKRDDITRITTESTSSSKDELIELFLGVLPYLSEMQPRRSYPGNYAKLLNQWLEGRSISEIAALQKAQPERLGSFVEEFFSYLLPWGMSGLTKIATKILNLDENLFSGYFKFFPSMVKYGVPTPSASWAMSVGMPSRDVAIRLSARYLSEVKVPDYDGFLKWVEKISTDDLKFEFNLKSPILEDASNALFQSGTNSLLKEHSSVEEILPLETYVRGIGYDHRELAAGSVRVGQELRLVREYENPVDRNAIGVYLDGQSIGFLERQLAQLAAPDVDCGIQLVARVVEVTRGRIPEIKIEVSVKPSGMIQ